MISNNHLYTGYPTQSLDVRDDTLIEHRDTTSAAAGSYWMADIPKQGRAAFNANPSGYKVFRNVKDYGAVGKYADCEYCKRL